MAPPVRLRTDTVLTRKPTDGSNLSRFRQSASTSFVATTFADSPTGSLVVGGSVPFEQVGASPNPIANGRVLPLLRGVRDRPAMRRYAPAGSFVSSLFSEQGTGALVFGGSTVEARVSTDAPTGSLVLGGSVVQAKTGADAVTGSVVLVGSASSAGVETDTATGAIVVNGSVVEQVSRAGVETGTLVFGGTCSDAFSGTGTFTDTPAGGLVLGGSVVEAYTRANVQQGGGGGGVTVKPRRDPPPLWPRKVFEDVPVGALRFAGSAETITDLWSSEEDEVELILALA